ncbi:MULTISPECIES: genetic competence negative regulator [Paenibacillus]|uniref:Adaptor protein n=1 Tax=Paenibacillus campinasensis TaxID=66347 RepID=A0A268F2Y0_9BACL|nr:MULTISPECIES: genetic competence negative regulator [Paenibacillus]MUG64976.1 genetic competence negative regulator [Paenibacillus campinasensis]PAD79694.1 adaptor protein [Paenibacillus campinasensis]PAK53557.1 adaptor protein [Paenibacillus sp. 7541]
MKIERLSQDKIRIFLTFDDLSERGIQKEEMWQEIPKVYDLFTEMMDQAYSELGFDATGPLAVEVFALPAQGMVVIVTRGKYDHHFGGLSEDEMPDEIYEMEVTLDHSDTLVYVFQDFEVLIEAAHMLKDLVNGAGKLYHHMDKWFLYLEPEELDSDKLPAAVAVLAEFGESSPMTEAVLEEYGNKIMPQHAVDTICAYFQRQK